MSSPQNFSFGENWRVFLERLDDERIKTAEASLVEFLKLSDLRGKDFLDIGCGSGLFSLAAHNLGAKRVVSFDPDPLCVNCCNQLRTRANSPNSWEVLQGSILDEAFISRLGTFDIAYSWGVLHHTGRMWDAIDNAAALVSPGGYYYIALYNKILTRSGTTSWIHPFWTKVKKTHNSHPWLGTYVMEPLAMAAYLAIVIARGQNPVAHVRNYRSQRGMSWRTDATDWLGGYPYEYATVEEVFTFVTSRRPDFILRNIKTTGGRGLNWYLFQRR